MKHCLTLLAWTSFLMAGCSTAPLTETNPAAETPVRRVLCLASEDLRGQGLDHLDPQALALYRSNGYALDFAYYQQVDLETLKTYHAVVGMMPMLHAGTRAISESLGVDLNAYIAGGGSFALLPAPSYYGGADFIRQLNPFLEPFGLELMNEQPRDPDHQRTLSHIIAYRYLQTTNLTPHAITKDVDSLWLPLDYTDAYVLTHTFRANTDWTVLVRGNPSTATYPFEAVAAGRRDPGTYATEPPFLAVREWGQGRMAVFATSSQYFIFDAYHRAFQNGFVMNEGGAQLMTQLLDWLTDTGVEPTPEKDRDTSHDEMDGNVPVMPNQIEWMRWVTERQHEEGFSAIDYVDCGALSDLPWTETQPTGFLENQNSWTIRWSWREMFHKTGANARGFNKNPLTYRFDGLDPDASYRAAFLVWAPKGGMADEVGIRFGEEPSPALVAVPSMTLGEGPRLQFLDVPKSAVESNGRLEIHLQPGTNTGNRAGSLSELWLFKKGALQRSISDLIKTLPQEAAVRETVQTRRYARGLIGAASPRSGGDYSVQDLSEAAKESGLDFLVFLDDLAALGGDEWTDYVSECQSVSDESFRAVPGLSFETAYQNTPLRCDNPHSRGTIRAYVFQNLEQVPEDLYTDSPHRAFWRIFGGEWSGGHGAPPTLLTPSQNGISPYFQRFWRGLNLITQDEGGVTTDDSRKLYADLIADGYGPQPRTSGVYLTPGAIQQAATSGWQTVVETPSLEALESHHYASNVSNGPRLLNWQLSFDHSEGVGPGGGILFVDSTWVLIHAAIQYDPGLARVTLYDGQQVVRRWYPNNPSWSVTEPVHVGRRREFWLHAEGTDGRELFTGRIITQENTFQLGMCGDNQNTIGNLVVKPLSYERDERQIFQPHAYWHTGEAGGQMGVMLNPSLHVPRVIETGIIQPVKQFHPTPRLQFKDGSVEDHLRSEMRIINADRDHNVIEYRFDSPGCRARSTTRLTTFRPSAQGATAILIESELEALEDLDLMPGEGLTRLRIALLPGLTPAWQYAFQPPGQEEIVEGAFPYEELGTWTLRGQVREDSGVWFGPGDIACLLVLPLDGTTYHLDLKLLKGDRGRDYAGFHDPASRISAGETHRAKFLVLLYPGEPRNHDQLDPLASLYRTLPARFSNWAGATPESSPFLASAQVEAGAVRFDVDTIGLTDPLPLRLRGLNPHWDTVLVDGGQSFVRQPSYNGEWNLTLEPGRKQSGAFAGHPVLAEHTDLILEWGGIDSDELVFYIHNPTSEIIASRCWIHPAWTPAPLDADVHVELQPGQGRWIRLPLSQLPK